MLSQLWETHLCEWTLVFWEGDGMGVTQVKESGVVVRVREP